MERFIDLIFGVGLGRGDGCIWVRWSPCRRMFQYSNNSRDLGITAETLSLVMLLRGLSIPTVEPRKLGPSQRVMQRLSMASGKPGQEGGMIVFTSTLREVLRHLVRNYQTSVTGKLFSIRATFLPCLFVCYRSADF